MALFTTLASAATMTMLVHFLLCSRFRAPKAGEWRQVICWIGCWLLLCMDFHWSVHAVAAFFAAVFLAWYIGQARVPDALKFGVLVGILWLAALLFAFSLARILNGLDATSIRIVYLTALYAITACAAVIGSKWRDTPMPILRLLPVWLVSVILCGEIIRTGSRRAMGILEFFSVVWLLYGGIPLAQVEKKMEAEQREIWQHRQKAYHYAKQEEYYQQLQSKQAETRALWHDLNKYLRAAKAETDSAHALEQLGAMLNSSMEIVDVGNPVLNVILNEYAQTAKATGIELRMKVQVPERLGISAADLYVVIGNTMDNAIEACKALPAEERLIDLVIRTHYDTVYFQLTNPCVLNTPKRSSNLLRGYGLNNVRRCVESYDGNMEVRHEGGFFTVIIHLNQNRDEAAVSGR